MSSTQFSNGLVVPVQLNATYIEGSRTVTDAKADFSRLPWSNGAKDNNSSTPFLGESVLSPPFQDKNFELAQGVHVHWVLPKTHRTYPTGSNTPPAAPNRWLVKRVKRTKDGTTITTEAHWVVESDYCSENSNIHNRNAITTPTNHLGENTGQPWVYQGRQLTFEDWKNEPPIPVPDTGSSPSEFYWDYFGKGPLTAFGYGELSFNTFYPNCRSVFGFFDPLGKEGDTYEVMGWYDNHNDDIVQVTLNRLNTLLNDASKHEHLLKKVCEDGDDCPGWLKNLIGAGQELFNVPNPPFLPTSGSVAGAESTATINAKNWLIYSLNGNKDYYKDLRARLLSQGSSDFTLQSLIDVLPTQAANFVLNEYYNFGIRQALGWSFDATESYPNTSLYYANIDVGASDPPTFTDVAVGNTGAEALSCYLGNELSSTDTTPEEIAEQLSTLLLAGSVQNDLVDLDANLKETEHNQAFKAIDSGLIWRIRKMKQPSSKSKEATHATLPSEQEEIPPLPESIADALNELNVAQEAYQKGQEVVESRKAQLYANWCKYMQTSYPPMGVKLSLPDDDVVKQFVAWELGNVTRKQNEVGQLISSASNQPCSVSDKNCTVSGILDTQLFNSYGKVKALLHAFNKTILPDKKKKFPYELSEVPAPRFYEAKDPVILFAATSNDDIVVPAKDALAVTWLKEIEQNVLVIGEHQEFCSIDDLTENFDTGEKEDFACAPTSWSPQILQWLTSFFPKGEGSNLGSSSGNYDTDFVAENFSIHTPTGETDPTFDFTPENQNTLPAALEYSGSTFVSVHTKKHMQDVLKDYLLKQYSSVVTRETWDANWKTIATQPAYKAKNNHSLDHTAFDAYKALEHKLILTQSLGGFNQALIQQANNIHLPVKDPLGFSSYQGFTESIRDLLNPKVQKYPGHKVRSKKTYPSPNIDDQYMPIRAGRLDLNKLTFLDYFGVENNMTFGEGSGPDVFVSKSLQVQYVPSGVWLNPRLTQASRLNFRWLAAKFEGSTDVEMNSHPATTPICGWLLPNYFDDSLVAYDRDGIGLGSLSFDDDSSASPWSPFPGSETPIEGPLSASTMGIDAHLLKVLIDIQEGISYSDTGEDNSFLDKVEEGQAAVSPEYYAGDSMAILMGKPMAVVRANISLETQGDLVHDQSWMPFQKQLNGHPGQTDAYEQVQFNIRLGDNGQLDDGLIAFWEELALDATSDAKWVNDTQTNTVGLALSDAPKTITLLMDPHGIVHAASGILPVKTIRIPADQYSKALKRIAVTFKTRPILTPTDRLQLSLPQEHGYSWSWLQEDLPPTGQDHPDWVVTPDVPLISQAGFTTGWNAYLTKLGQPTSGSIAISIPQPGSDDPAGTPMPYATAVWAYLLDENWVVSLPKNAALFQIMSTPDSIFASTGEKHLADFIQAVEDTLHGCATGITPYNPQAQFYPKQHLLEGWLKIAPSTNSETSN